MSGEPNDKSFLSYFPLADQTDTTVVELALENYDIKKQSWQNVGRMNTHILNFINHVENSHNTIFYEKPKPDGHGSLE